MCVVDGGAGKAAPVSVATESETAFSCSAMYGIVPKAAMIATSAATVGFFP